MTRTMRHAAVLEAPTPFARPSARQALRRSPSPRRSPRTQAACAARSHTRVASRGISESKHPLHLVVSGSKAAVHLEPSEEGRL